MPVVSETVIQWMEQESYHVEFRSGLGLKLTTGRSLYYERRIGASYGKYLRHEE